METFINYFVECIKTRPIRGILESRRNDELLNFNLLD